LRHVVFAGGGGGSKRALNFALAPNGAVSRRFQWHDPYWTPPLAEPDSAPALDEEASRFVRYLFERAGINARAYRDETIRRRLPACLRVLRAASFRHAREILESAPSLIQMAISTLVIGVTGFFRDSAVFDHLTMNVLPEIARLRLPPRIWSAGCSDGSELYSVAILLRELQLHEGAHLLGTDCRLDAVRRGRDAIYDEPALRDVPPPWKAKFFESHGSLWQVCSTIRAMTQWRSGDLVASAEPGAWDMVLCRNLTMYLKPSVASEIFAKLEQAIRPGGYLVLGKAERPIGAHRLSPLAPCIFRRDRG
jgi:chemotaxis methyl-accepting protein methylase